ncbi:MAG: hypothetical protein MJ108_09310 [Saccharofermentans sp.]|nr:hypothetical protein [Saccharofermentans sp.]
MNFDDLLDIAGAIDVIRLVVVIAFYTLVVMVMVNLLIYLKNDIDVKDEHNRIMAKILNEIARSNDLKCSEQTSRTSVNVQKPIPVPVSNMQSDQLLDEYIRNAEKK